MSGYDLADIFSLPQPRFNPRIPSLATLSGYFKTEVIQMPKKQLPMMCRYFRNPGGCDKGTRCGYLHDSGETRTKYKTEMCKRFLGGHCKYGNQCSFAHGQNQLSRK